MTSWRPARRVSRGVLAAAAVVLVTSSLVSASAAAPVDVSGGGVDTSCEPAAQPGVAAAPMARLSRAEGQRSYTLRELRRIDRRLDRVLARKEISGARGDARFGLVLRIPVYAHVIDGTHSRGPTERAVRRQIDVLNSAYGGGQSEESAATRFRFYLESFDRTRNERWFTASLFDAADKELRRRLHQGGPEALNLYISAPRSTQTDNIVLGWSTVPWKARRHPNLDGVTIHRASLPGGGFSRYNRGDTTVHEVGHWLGLFHTFEGGCSPGNDRVEDTPAEAEPSLGCEIGRDTCESEGLDPIRNFMNYSFDDCMNMFTPGQAARMTDNWLAYRTP